ncbi:MAG: hypothetical protein ABWY56_10580, partial [Propionibacteriaceae bacterium]
EVDGHQFAMSQGSDTGYCAAMALAPTDDFAVAVLTNSDEALMLVNDTVWQAAALFLGVTLEPASPVAVDAAHLEAASGRFALWDGMAFEVGQQDGGLVLATTVGGQPLPALAGTLTLTGADRGCLAALGGQVWFDFVRGDERTVDWLRFAGRLAPRVG